MTKIDTFLRAFEAGHNYMTERCKGVPPSRRAESKGRMASKYISKCVALATERDQRGEKQHICTNLPTPLDVSCAKYQNPSLSQTFNIFPETKHHFFLKNSLFSNHSAVKREQIIFILNIIRRRQESGIGIPFNDS